MTNLATYIKKILPEPKIEEPKVVEPDWLDGPVHAIVYHMITCMVIIMALFFGFYELFSPYSKRGDSIFVIIYDKWWNKEMSAFEMYMEMYKGVSPKRVE